MLSSRQHSPSAHENEASTSSTAAMTISRTPTASSFLSEMVATPTGTVVPTKLDFQSPMPPHARLASAAMLATPAGKKALGLMLLEGATTPSLELPITCNFDALSNHFHLPLKIAAEKFGVRATAFKKRCRAIGIRHWPYRKVRSLKRSLEELNRCREQGLLNDKQHHQLAVFQSQLDKLLSPETYGIDPSGRLPPGAFDHDDGDDIDQDSSGDDDASCASNQSPRIQGVTAFADFKITSFRAKRSKKNPEVAMKSHLPTIKRGDFSMPPGIITAANYGDGPAYYRFPSGDEMSTSKGGGSGPYMHNEEFIPSVSVRFAPHTGSAGSGLPGFDSYDPFFHDFKSEFTLTMEDFGGEDSVPSSYGIDTSVHDDFFPFSRSPTMATLRASTTPSGSHRTSSRANSSSRPSSADTHSRSPNEESETGDDDVFLQISPDYGCLV